MKTENLKSNEIPFEVLTYLQPNRINDDDEVHDVHGGGGHVHDEDQMNDDDYDYDDDDDGH